MAAEEPPLEGRNCLPATRRWFLEATPFAGVEPVEPLLKAEPVTLEAFLASQR
jgi:hypothetical protein